MSYPELLLSNQLCFLVHRLDLAITARYRPVLSELGLTYGQYLAMLAFWEHRELGVGELCKFLALDTGTVSPLLKRLEAAGLIERRRRADDERAVSVRLTSAGAALEKKARAVPATLSGCLAADEKDYARMRALLGRMIARLESTPKKLQSTASQS
jgi:MarR family transcriptional regulator, organic hydroperoxide resistance regulator